MQQIRTIRNFQEIRSLWQTVTEIADVVNSSVEFAECWQCGSTHPDNEIFVLITIVVRSITVQLPD